MRTVNLVTLLLVIIGGLNWGLVGLMEFNLVTAIFGEGTMVTGIVYILVGLAALWQLMPLVKAMSSGETTAQHAG